jgi:hypothetical protein
VRELILCWYEILLAVRAGVEMSPEFFSDSGRMEQWTSTAKLRRLEVERIIETFIRENDAKLETKE